MRLLTPYFTRRSFVPDLFDDADRMLESTDFSPACDVSMTDDDFVFTFDLPGLKKEDIKVDLEGKTLTVSGERKREIETDKNEKIQRYERSYGFFQRSFTLPTSVDADKVVAKYENGVLHLKVPKAQAAKPRQIEILT